MAIQSPLTDEQVVDAVNEKLGPLTAALGIAARLATIDDECFETLITAMAMSDDNDLAKLLRQLKEAKEELEGWGKMIDAVFGRCAAMAYSPEELAASSEDGKLH